MAGRALALTAVAAFASGSRDVTLVVKSDGTGQFSSVQKALDSLQPGLNPGLGHVTIELEGFFWERVQVYANFTGGVTFIGTGNGPDANMIAYNITGSSAGTSASWTMRIEADDFTATNIAVVNNADNYNAKVAGQSVALDIEGDRAAFFNVNLYGAQDTLYTGRRRNYFADAYINGTCDAIFGDGASVFERAMIRMNYTVTAHKGQTDPPGGSGGGGGHAAYLFIDSDLDSLGSAPGALLLGRPWGPQATVVFVNTTMGVGVSGPGWDDWGHGCSAAPHVPGTTWCNQTFYAEYKSHGPGADPSGSHRVWWSHQLTDQEAANWTVATVLGDWTPTPPQRRSAVVAHVDGEGSRPALVKGDWLSVAPGAKVCNVLNYGAKGDGTTDDTKALQAALDDCTSGGTVFFPAPYVFLSFGLVVSNAVNYVVDVAGTLRFSDDIQAWSTKFQSCLTFNGGGPVAMTGGGLVDGNGYNWWKTQGKTGFRPGLIKTGGVSVILVSNLTFINSPNHQLELFSDNQEVVDTTITASPACQNPPNPDPTFCAHNTDGIDTHNNYAAWVHRCHISTGDDNVAIHGNNTLVEDNVFGYGHGVSIGSLGQNTYLTNITVRDSSFNGTEQALRIKSDPGATGFLNDVTYSSLNMTGVGCTIMVTMFYPAPNPNAPPTTLNISNIVFQDITSQDSAWAGQFDCDTHMPCTGITLDNVQHTGVTPKLGWQCQAAYGTATGVTPSISGCLQS